MIHRIPFTDLTDPSNPIAFVLEVTGDDDIKKAYDLLKTLKDPIGEKLPKEIRRLPLRFEEVLPFVRKGHCARRRAWKPDLIMRPGSQSRLVLCERDLLDPTALHEVIEDWGVSNVLGIDILAEDWELAAIPPTSRGEIAQ